MKNLISFLFVFLFAIPVITAQPPTIDQTTDNNLQTVNVSFPSGNLIVYLPKKMHAGDRISGTVMAEPSGKKEKEAVKNGTYLQGCVVAVKNKSDQRSKNGILTFLTPLATSALTFLVTGPDGKNLGEFNVPVDVAPRRPATVPQDFNIPSLGQGGDPMFLAGPSDGVLENTFIRFGTTSATPLAESPDGIIVQAPTGIAGQQSVLIRDSDIETYGETRIVDVQLGATHLNLMQGQSTDLSLTVSGLTGILEPVNVQLTNGTPGNIRLSGGDFQCIEIHPAMVGADGSYRLADVITSRHTGSFSVAATVMLPLDDLLIKEDDPRWHSPTSLVDQAELLERLARQYRRCGKNDLADTLEKYAKIYRERAAELEKKRQDQGDPPQVAQPPATGAQPASPPENPKPRETRPQPVPPPVPVPMPKDNTQKNCDCDKVTKSLEYSRGNNEDTQLKRQFAKTGKYIYETARIKLNFEADPGKACPCKKNQCEGSFILTLKMEVNNLLDPIDQPGLPEPTNYALLDGVEVAGAGTTTQNGNIPAPNVRTESEAVDAPAARPENNFAKPNAGKRDYNATAKTSIPCTPGIYKRRFLIVGTPFPGGRKTPGVFGGNPDLTAYVDAEVEVKSVGDCQLEVKIKAWYLEFIAQYPWDKNGGAELPDLDYEIPGLKNTATGAAEPKGKTKNIAKLITEDGVKVDDPFPPKAK